MTGETYIKRLTMFKIPKEEDVEKVLKAYEVLRSDAKRASLWRVPLSLLDGKPYVVSNTARKILNSSAPISEGFTVASQSIFKTHEDHDFYDKECPAHKKLKETTGPAKTGVITIVTEGQWPEPRL
ncbi:hypothetical protein M409DRAFT_63729 [Zasmidium cellare ATCC 36951]|uniref:Stress-response A/B barrel domain-containing protein n=1 Tax=Zasmidium cellare ATCC 36951 TaxID=1080233 RepID=A0A6A6CXN7_ZASCE|nr:uncharacterized protein M409DRAFT_63729 [Zasmidium cellare ATCC 36951]KAF2171473.1 hypothetical protein M409DRAFT_63729 [Zasmidium cellare ATCC 36951]